MSFKSAGQYLRMEFKTSSPGSERGTQRVLSGVVPDSEGRGGIQHHHSFLV